MFLKNQSTILPTNIQKIFHVSKPPRRLSLPFSPFSGYLWLSLAISAFLASLHPSSLPAFLRFHPSVLPSILPSILPSHLPSVPSFLTSHVRSKTCVEGRFSYRRYTSGKPGGATEVSGWQVGNFLTLHVRSKTCVEGRFSYRRYTSGKPGGAQRGRNSVVPNRFGIDVPWKAVWRG